jgi:hypothetical protein
MVKLKESELYSLPLRTVLRYTAEKEPSACTKPAIYSPVNFCLFNTHLFVFVFVFVYVFVTLDYIYIGEITVKNPNDKVTKPLVIKSYK